MLKKKYRLPASVRLGKASAKSFRHFIFKAVDSSLSYPRFAFVISKRVDKRAVVRNKIKREMTSYIQNIISTVSPGKDILFILKRSSVGNTAELLSDIKDALLKEALK